MLDKPWIRKSTLIGDEIKRAIAYDHKDIHRRYLLVKSLYESKIGLYSSKLRPGYYIFVASGYIYWEEMIAKLYDKSTG